jgi:hypothetical protein
MRVTKMRKFKNSIDDYSFVVGHRSARRQSIRIIIIFSTVPLPFFSFNNSNERAADIPKCQSAYVISMTEIKE